MYVSHTHKLVFLALAKNASRTISSFLRHTADAMQVDGHHGFMPIKGIRNYRAVAVVRNPYARIVSRWWNWTQNKDDGKDKSFENYVQNIQPMLSNVYRNFKFPMPQVDSLALAQVNFQNPILVLKLENIQEEWKTLKLHGDAGYFPTKDKQKRGVSGYGKWQDYYDKHWLKVKIQSAYKADFESFEYNYKINH